MRLVRTVSAAAAAALLAAAVIAGTGPAGAQAAGAGTSLSTTKVLTAQVGEKGSILDLGLVTDEAQSSTDTAVGTPGAFARLTLVKAASTIVPGNPITNTTFGVYEAKNTGPTSTPIPTAAAFPTVAPILSGSVVPGVLNATLDKGVAASGLNTELANVNAVGGLVSVASVKSALTSSAAGDNAAGQRSASITNVTVLDLGAFLQGLGIQLPNLTVGQLAALVDQLGATTGLPLPSGQTTFTGAVTSLNAAIDDLQASIASVTTASPVTSVTGAIDPATATLLGTISGVSPLPTASTPDIATAIDLVNQVIDDLQAQVNALLSEGLKALDNLALLRLEDVEVGVNAKAVSDPKASVAAVTGKIGKISVGNVSFAGVDLTATADQLSTTVGSVNTKLSQVLGGINAGLANVVKVSVLDKASEVTTANGYTKASAGITGATAVITPPAAIAQIVDTVNNTANADQVIDHLPPAAVTALNLSTAMNQLGSTLSLGLGVLTSPTTVKAAEVLAAANFRSGAATTTGAPGELPRTGGSTLPYLLAAVGAAALAIGARRFAARPAPIAMRRVHDHDER
jgi:hypothetical protein